MDCYNERMLIQILFTWILCGYRILKVRLLKQHSLTMFSVQFIVNMCFLLQLMQTMLGFCFQSTPFLTKWLGIIATAAMLSVLLLPTATATQLHLVRLMVNCGKSFMWTIWDDSTYVASKHLLASMKACSYPWLAWKETQTKVSSL